MPQIDPTHQHWRSQIIEDGQHTPITPGGSLTVTDGTTSVAASTMQMANASVADAGSGTATVTALGPAAWDGDFLNRPALTDYAYLEMHGDTGGPSNAGKIGLGGADGDTGQQGGSAYLIAGGGNGATTSYGGLVTLDGGHGDGTGGNATLMSGQAASGTNKPGGDVIIAPQAGDGSGRHGLVILGGIGNPALPTADPHVAGALWNNSGVVTVSAG